MRMENCIIWILMSLLVGLASCKKDPEIPTGTTFNSIYVEDDSPSISILQDEGYVQNGDVINLNTEINFGFDIVPNPITNKGLATLVVKIDDDESLTETIDLTGLFEYTYTGSITYTHTRAEIVGTSVITAMVTDAAGQIATATIRLSITQPAVDLVVEDINWVKTGHNAQDLSAYGLFWQETNYKSPFTHILPAEGSTLYLVENGDEVFNSIVTDIDLNNKFAELAETGRPIDDYKNIDCSASANYHDLLIVKEANGKLHAINITHAAITTPAAGTRITITGNAK